MKVIKKDLRIKHLFKYNEKIKIQKKKMKKLKKTLRKTKTRKSKKKVLWKCYFKIKLYTL